MRHTLTTGALFFQLWLGRFSAPETGLFRDPETQAARGAARACGAPRPSGRTRLRPRSPFLSPSRPCPRRRADRTPAGDALRPPSDALRGESGCPQVRRMETRGAKTELRKLCTEAEPAVTEQAPASAGQVREAGAQSRWRGGGQIGPSLHYPSDRQRYNLPIQRS